jgi:hypothetical protein
MRKISSKTRLYVLLDVLDLLLMDSAKDADLQRGALWDMTLLDKQDKPRFGWANLEK